MCQVKNCCCDIKVKSGFHNNFIHVKIKVYSALFDRKPSQT